jgi:peptide deformylase
MLPIVQAPHQALSQVAKPIKKFDKQLQSLIKEMIVTLENTTDPEGVGLAAPQVAESLQLFIIKETPKSQVLVFINPEILSVSPQQHDLVDGSKGKKKKDSGVKLEGCLSLKDIWGIVHRAESVTITYQDEQGSKHTRTYNGFLATIVQHECDHLQGILFPKRVLEQKEKLYQSIEENGETVFEEISI